MGGPFQPSIRAASPGRGFRLIALTGFYSPRNVSATAAPIVIASRPPATTLDVQQQARVTEALESLANSCPV